MEYEIKPVSKTSLGLKELWEFRELFYFFAWRDIKVKYKQTVLGVLWAILQPFLLMIILTLFFGQALGVNHNSIQTWRTSYKKGGLSALLKFDRGGFKPSVIPPKVHRAIEKRLKNPIEAFNGFEQLRRWIDEHYIPAINYQTLNQYVKRHFGAKLKVARKSHIQKDEQAVREFKKNF
ncbi:MAG: hypothetical protein HY840_02260 [Bacteroidetes bacterium]|nr:hypothetical protein [Bacteroidota bacterium]